MLEYTFDEAAKLRATMLALATKPQRYPKLEKYYKKKLEPHDSGLFCYRVNETTFVVPFKEALPLICSACVVALSQKSVHIDRSTIRKDVS